MSLSEEERTLIAKAVADEISKRESRIAKFFKHPAVLIVLGFLLTTVFGSILQLKEWRNQQEFRLAEEKYREQVKVLRKVSRTLGEYKTLIDERITPYYWKDESMSEEGFGKAKEGWNSRKRQIKIDLGTIENDILMNFSEVNMVNAQMLIDTFDLRRRVIDNDLNNRHEEMSPQEYWDTTLTTDLQRQTFFHKLTEIMVQRIHLDTTIKHHSVILMNSINTDFSVAATQYSIWPWD